jgi:hypothetical protein
MNATMFFAGENFEIGWPIVQLVVVDVMHFVTRRNIAVVFLSHTPMHKLSSPGVVIVVCLIAIVVAEVVAI